MNWDKMDRYGRGIWAGAIRYHDKKFWIYFGDPDMGYLMTTAKKAEGSWEPLTKILGVPKSLAKVTSVKLLGQKEPISFSQDDKGLKVVFPSEQIGDYAWTLMIERI